jgi:hypothetical protein
MSTSIDETKIPRYAMFRGKRVRILQYVSQASRPFEILEADDSRRWVSRQQLTFIKEKAKEEK